MNEILAQSLTEAALEIVSAIVLALAGWAAVAIKKFAKEKLDTQVKKDVVKTCVQAGEQLYKDLKGPEKFDKVLSSALDLLQKKGIAIDKEEVTQLIEAAVGEFNEVFKKEDKVKSLHE